MPLTINQSSEAFDETEKLLASELATSSVVHMVLKAAIELNLLDIMAKAGPAKKLSATEIAALLPAQNPDAPDMLDRMLRLLDSYSILTCSQVTTDDDRVQRLYGFGPVCRHFVPNQYGVSLTPLLLMIHHKVCIDSWHHLKDAVLEGEIAFNKAHEMYIFEYLAMDPSFNEVFNKTMFNLSTLVMKGILTIYDGFEKANVVVDVGGGLGENIDLITSKYPMIKMIIHNWSDGHCLKLLKNCHEALPEDGKVVVLETILSATPETNVLAKGAFRTDLLMMTQHIGGKERTGKEYRALAKEAGFNGCRLICRVLASSVLQFYKMK